MRLNHLRQAALTAMQAFLLLSLVLPALVPTGYMVKRNAATYLVEITVCSRVNHRQVLLDVDTGSYHELDQITGATDLSVTEFVDAELCPFAVTALAVLPDIEVSAFLPGLQQFAAAPATSQPHPTFTALPPARGPPTLS